MTAVMTFERTGARVRRARFVRTANVPIDAACLVANGIRETLRALAGAPVEATLGEPVALDGRAWRALTHDALTFVTPGRTTDAVMVVARGDAHRLVQAAFGEDAPRTVHAWTPLELRAAERIAARCAGALEPLCAERRGPTRAVDPAALAPCAALFDVRVGAPFAVTIGIGITHAPPAPPSPVVLGMSGLARVSLDVRAVFGRGSIAAPRLLELRAGDVVVLDTKVDGEGELKVGNQRVARGICGVVNGLRVFHVRSVTVRGDPW
jgi:flagellar motor switch/type III secretory pathway protein FliN